MQSLRAAVTILFAAAAFILPGVAAATASQAATTGTSVTPSSYAPDDNPWN
ncbi:MAG: hypothetical protein V7637_5047 [Mycobacteriales bacterium]|jgi:hypothetical protein